MLPNWKRHLIPKWRESKVTAKLPESLPVLSERNSVNNRINENTQLYVSNLIQEWKNDKTLGGAANLLSFGHVAELHSTLKEPAQYIIERKEKLPLNLFNFAKEILGEDIDEISTTLIQEPKLDLYKNASLLKWKLFTNPRDAISLIDLARIYTSLGQNKKARTAIVTAVSLFPNHRFILRSASRFFIHNNEVERALYILNKADKTKIDPWLMATHISVSTILNKPQKLANKVKALIKSENFDPIHMSELCGSIATIQMIDGNTKEARRNINASLKSPNDNSIAQAVWMAHQYQLSINTQKEWFCDRFSSEARFYKYDSEGDFESSFLAAKEWMLDEPFSSHPAIATVYSATLLEKYEYAENYARSALLLHQNNTNLKGNLVYALASQNKLPEAEITLLEVAKIESQLTNSISPQTMANLGMLSYRTGDSIEGEKMYRNAIGVYEKTSDSTRKALALASLAKEAKLAEAENADSLIKEAVDAVNWSNSKAAEKILSSIINKDTDIGVLMKKGKPSLMKPNKWRYDKERNLIIFSNNPPFRIR